MTEAELLDMMNRSLVLVNLETLAVSRFHNCHRRFTTKKPNQHPLSGRWRFNFGNQSIYRNRLVWIWVHRQPIPTGYVVDHINGNREDDNPFNLQLMTREESHRQGHKIGRAGAGWESRCLLMEYVEFNGNFPPENSPWWN